MEPIRVKIKHYFAIPEVIDNLNKIISVTVLEEQPKPILLIKEEK